MQITMTLSTLSNGCSSASAERDSTLTEEQALDEAIVVIGVSISCWNPFFLRHLNILRVTWN